eukprot:GHVP01016910.1.p1 GENE.GHVP01016910.1~~GHVP01016910.1.p1  ORF type:complete len:129 (+),score=9.98 GHVP01016910.1:155-541(+)
MTWTLTNRSGVESAGLLLLHTLMRRTTSLEIPDPGGLLCGRVSICTTPTRGEMPVISRWDVLERKPASTIKNGLLKELPAAMYQFTWDLNIDKKVREEVVKELCKTFEPKDSSRSFAFYCVGFQNLRV